MKIIHSTKKKKHSGQSVRAKKSSIKRYEWGNQVDFLVTGVGGMVGIGNYWRFPSICYEHGGGLFFIPYLICVLFVGVPILVLECGASQYIGSMTASFSYCQLFSGISILCCFVAIYTIVYYIVVLSWALLYIGHTYKHPLPWSHCNGEWATPLCELKQVSLKNCTGEYVPYNNGTCYNVLSGKLFGIYNTTLAEKHKIKSMSAAEEFLKYKSLSLGRSSGISDVGPVQWRIALCLAISWILTFLAQVKGAKSSSKVIYVLTVIPLIVMMIQIVLGFNAKGSGKGISNLLYPDASHFTANAWKNAVGQVFFSVGLGTNVWPYLASKNRFERNIIFDSCFMITLDTLASFFSSIVVFCFIGSFSLRINVPLRKAVASDRTLAFVFMPEELARIRFGRVWCFLHFLMFFCMGFSTQIVYFGGIVNFLTESFKIPIDLHVFFSGGLSVVFFLIGLSMTTPGGIYILTIIDDYAYGWNCIVAVLLMLVALAIYGMHRFCENIEQMVGPMPMRKFPWKYMRWYFLGCWKVISPLCLLIVFIIHFASYTPSQVGDYVLPPAANAFGWLLSVFSVISVFVYMIWKLLKQKGTIKDRFYALLKPYNLWLSANLLGSERRKYESHLECSESGSFFSTRRKTFFGSVYNKSSMHHETPLSLGFDDESTETLGDMRYISSQSEISPKSITISEGSRKKKRKKKKKSKKRKKKKKNPNEVSANHGAHST